ncbi:squalene/phytoene synthase family protein [Streptodolium elevatio]
MESRVRRLDDWTERARSAMGGGTADHPLMRAYLNSCETRGLPWRWVEDYLTGARVDLDFSEFATEADYQRYIDQLSWPFAMATAGLVHPGGGGDQWAEGCRWLADGCQRSDFLMDLAEDMRGGRLYLPLDALARHGVSRADLAEGRDTPGVRALLAEVVGQARTALGAADGFVTGAPEAHFRCTASRWSCTASGLPEWRRSGRRWRGGRTATTRGPAGACCVRSGARTRRCGPAPPADGRPG